MLINILINLIYICFSKKNFVSFGIYNLFIENSFLYYYKRYLSITDNFKYPNTFFRVKKVTNNYNDTYYYIEELLKRFKLSYLESKELKFKKNNNDNSSQWNFIKINDNNYVIQNYDCCYIKIKKTKVFCLDIKLYEATQFKIIRIFSEVNENKSFYYFNLLNNEPIDIIIKYIDLKDPNLKRTGIHQIEKDYDNEELRYSIRSIFKNIPWVRKIFILMPNEKVRYFKDYNLIKEKIVYVKDKDILGYESSNSNAFQFRLWKMKKFGASDNIILMDDDCFIGDKLNKSDFFYIKNGEVMPLIITSNFLRIDKNTAEKNYIFYEKKIRNNNEEQNQEAFLYSKYLTLSFILNLFNVSFKESIYIPDFTHNAIPINLKDIKEAYDLIYNSKYKYPTLDCKYRIPGYIQFQTFMISYSFIKYDKKVKNIPNKYIRLNNSISEDYKFQLFCINKGAGNYSYLNFYKAKIIMEYLFPNPTIYEISDNSIINLSFNTVYSMNQIIKINEKQITNMVIKLAFFDVEKLLLLIIIFIIIKINIKIYY